MEKKSLSKGVKAGIAIVAVALIAGVSIYATTSSADAGITEAEAKQIALAEVPGADTSHITKFQKDEDDGRLEYDIEIVYDGYEYDFEISAEDGTIFDRSKEVADEDDIAKINNESSNKDAVSNQSSNGNGNGNSGTNGNNQTVVVTPKESSGGQSGQNSSGISMEQAKRIALAEVPGATASNITKADRDDDDGYIEYEIEIKYNGYEYDFEISGKSGKIISKDIERDDD